MAGTVLGLMHETRKWSGSILDQFDSEEAIKRRAWIRDKRLRDPLVWQAVLGLQRYYMTLCPACAGGQQPANVALYMAVDGMLKEIRLRPTRRRNRLSTCWLQLRYHLLEASATLILAAVRLAWRMRKAALLRGPLELMALSTQATRHHLTRRKTWE